MFILDWPCFGYNLNRQHLNRQIMFTIYSKGVAAKKVAITITAPVLGWKALWAWMLML